MKSWRTWLALGACLAVMLSAMGYATLAVLRLERAQQAAQRQAEYEEAARLALWRLDAAVLPLLAEENSRPYFMYSGFYPAERAYSKMLGPVAPGEVLVASPLSKGCASPVLVHFQFAPDGRLSSPQAPELVPPSLAPPPAEAYRDRLAELGRIVTRDALLARLPPLPEPPPEPEARSAVANAPPATGDLQPVPRPTAPRTAPPNQDRPPSQMERNISEYNQRIANNDLQFNRRVTQGSMEPQRRGGRPPVEAGLREGPLAPVWIGQGSPTARTGGWGPQALLLARRVQVEGQVYVQGCQLDWPAMQADMLARVADLFPQARLYPAEDGQPGRMLAALPVRLESGPTALASATAPGPLRLSLAAAWAGLLVACAALAALLLGAMRLSRRRGDFVSAVTHELRTPLTTFRLYTDMLADGRVTDEARRHRYIQTLHAEAERLGRLVENVLSYAGLEAGRRRQLQNSTARALIEAVRPRLTERAARSDMELVVELGDGEPTVADLDPNCDESRLGAPTKSDVFARTGRSPADLALRADPSAVEHILLNLVDNACKYGAPKADAETPARLNAETRRHGDAEIQPNPGTRTRPGVGGRAEDRRIHLSVRGGRRFVEIAVCDHGPGIAPAQLRRLFRPFSKSARAAAESAPGIGLGLSLCRRLARQMGGDLRLEKNVDPARSGEGACFVLSLPRGKNP